MAEQMTKKQIKAFHAKVKCYSELLKEDYDFEWTYLLELMRFKLERMKKCIANGHLTERKKRAKEIGEVISLLERIVKDDYLEKMMKPFHKKYGKPKVVETEVGDPIPGLGKVYQLGFIYPNGKKETPAMSKEVHKIHLLADKAQQDDIDKAFALMAKNIRGWWD